MLSALRLDEILLAWCNGRICWHIETWKDYWVEHVTVKSFFKFLFRFDICITRGFPSGAVVKNPPANAGRLRRLGFHPCIGKVLWSRTWQPTPVFLPGKFHGQRIRVGYTPRGHRVRHSWATLWVHAHTHITHQERNLVEYDLVKLDFDSLIFVKYCKYFCLKAIPDLMLKHLCGHLFKGWQCPLKRIRHILYKQKINSGEGKKII